MQPTVDTARYARTIEASKRIRWDIDRDVLRARRFDVAKKYLPDGLSKAAELGFLGAKERMLFSQVQGRTYANLFGLIERYIGAKVLEVSRDHWLGDQSHICFDIGGCTVVGVTDKPLPAKAGDALPVSFPLRAIHLFDPETGDALAHGLDRA